MDQQTLIGQHIQCFAQRHAADPQFFGHFLLADLFPGHQAA